MENVQVCKQKRGEFIGTPEHFSCPFPVFGGAPPKMGKGNLVRRLSVAQSTLSAG
jgi:hypothetical protein